MDKVMEKYLEEADRINNQKPKKPTYEELEQTIIQLKKDKEELLYEVRRHDQNYMNY